MGSCHLTAQKCCKLQHFVRIGIGQHSLKMGQHSPKLGQHSPKIGRRPSACHVRKFRWHPPLSFPPPTPTGVAGVRSSTIIMCHMISLPLHCNSRWGCFTLPWYFMYFCSDAAWDRSASWQIFRAWRIWLGPIRLSPIVHSKTSQPRDKQ